MAKQLHLNLTSPSAMQSTECSGLKHANPGLSGNFYELGSCQNNGTCPTVPSVKRGSGNFYGVELLVMVWPGPYVPVKGTLHTSAYRTVHTSLHRVQTSV
ncbi:hypothetical protein ILYODFUR_021619 [Ilyodon furcidens]|uniref:Uncharacterized protein n=1 Tax=Ilyodon furcidens TaxID=33524 RepID=A0ABV0V4Z6_9TELE